MKIIKITGASSGIGRATALKFAQQGYHVVISARRTDKLKDVVSAAKGLSGRITSYEEDVTQLDMVRDVYAKMLNDIGHPDIVFLNAGISIHATIQDFDPNIYDKIYQTNQKGIINGLDPAMRDMMQRRSGHIALTASLAGYRGMPTATGYCMTKAALINLAEGLRPELQRYNVGLQLVNPGFVRTAMTDKNEFPMPFMIEAEEAADILFRELGTDRREIIFPKTFGYLMRFYRILPGWCIEKIGQKILRKRLTPSD
ncbi:MAG: SDR family NAD(P)-dependent oxidoreductase [Pseudomonadota bacterium]